ncbi:MAG: hypothetical protein IJ274_11775, partial [Lachnospiraceae bacterium]|nr:hypothetical protein [Lachnospiraceae bacterium]
KSLLLPEWFLGVGGLLAAAWGIYSIYIGQIRWQQWIAACLPGVLWIVLAFASGKQMGYGDGMILLVIGSLTDFAITMLLITMGLGMGCVWGVFLLISKRGNRHTELPFVPMLFLAYIMFMGGRLLL